MPQPSPHDVFADKGLDETWKLFASCRPDSKGNRPVPAEAFFAEQRRTIHGALQLLSAIDLCNHCSAAGACLEYGVKGLHSGVWGGRVLQGGTDVTVKIVRKMRERIEKANKAESARQLSTVA